MKPIAAPLRVEGQTTQMRDEPGNPEPGVAVAAPINLWGPQGSAPSVDAHDAGAVTAQADPHPNELLAIARSWDLWGGAAFVLFVVWMAVSSVFALA